MSLITTINISWKQTLIHFKTIANHFQNLHLPSIMFPKYIHLKKTTSYNISRIHRIQPEFIINKITHYHQQQIQLEYDNESQHTKSQYPRTSIMRFKEWSSSTHPPCHSNQSTQDRYTVLSLTLFSYRMIQ